MSPNLNWMNLPPGLEWSNSKVFPKRDLLPWTVDHDHSLRKLDWRLAELYIYILHVSLGLRMMTGSDVFGCPDELLSSTQTETILVGKYAMNILFIQPITPHAPVIVVQSVSSESRTLLFHLPASAWRHQTWWTCATKNILARNWIAPNFSGLWQI